MKKSLLGIGIIVFIVLNVCLMASCASTPTSTSPVPLPEPRQLSQREIRLDDPRMPLDIFYNHDSRGLQRRNWLGTQVSGLSIEEASAFYYTTLFRNLHINGVRVELTNSGYILLAPGINELNFSYHQPAGALNFNDVQVTVDMQPGMEYRFEVEIQSTSNATEAAFQRHILGYSSTTTSVTTGQLFLHENISKNSPNIQSERHIYLEPYDDTIPFSSQVVLDIRNGFYVVGFNGNEVSWGWNRDVDVIIGIPSGRHELQILEAGVEHIVYTVVLNFLPGRRYVIAPSGNFLVRDLYGNIAYRAATTIPDGPITGTFENRAGVNLSDPTSSFTFIGDTFIYRGRRGSRHEGPVTGTYTLLDNLITFTFDDPNISLPAGRWTIGGSNQNIITRTHPRP